MAMTPQQAYDDAEDRLLRWTRDGVDEKTLGSLRHERDLAWQRYVDRPSQRSRSDLSAGLR